MKALISRAAVYSAVNITSISLSLVRGCGQRRVNWMLDAESKGITLTHLSVKICSEGAYHVVRLEGPGLSLR